MNKNTLLATLRYQQNYWKRALTFEESALLDITDKHSDAFREQKFLISFSREMLSTCERWLEQIETETPC